MFDPLLFLACIVLDAIIGDPYQWPHMVRYMGRAIELFESIARPKAKSEKALFIAGGLMTFCVVAGFGFLAFILLWIGHAINPWLGSLVALFLGFQSLACGQLFREARNVAIPLEKNDLSLARKKLAMIVGRETDKLSATQIRQAIIETVAENLNDGVIAPMFYLALFGPIGGVCFKAINTLDSMVGYKNEKYKDFGFFAAKLDDMAGWIPARITAFLIMLSCFFLGLDAKKSYRCLKKDHKAHKSPNSAWPEAACAGALDIRLGGPNYYHGLLVEKPWINEKGRDPLPTDLISSLRILWFAEFEMALLCILYLI